jgi:predicted Ser/Thr protein kinase
LASPSIELQINGGAPQGPAAAATGELQRIGKDVRDGYARNRRVMSVAEFFSLYQADPLRHSRSSAQYLKDLFDHYGQSEVRHPTGTVRRFRLFDVPWDNGRDRLVGQEDVQNRVYRILHNFVREGRVNKLILLHGPNGSAKSTFLACLARALEHYSTLDEGAVYRFNWVFPSQRYSRANIGFAGSGGAVGEGPGRTPPVAPSESFAYLPEEDVDARLFCELRDHPLLLIPAEHRRRLLAETVGAIPGQHHLSDYIRYGELCQKCKQLFETLLTSYHGDYLKVLRHVQVERFYISRRYRVGAVTVEPQLSVDARARQITMDRSVQSLPAVLQSLSLFEPGGELVEANRGLIDYVDLLKRPLEAYKYLLVTCETGRVALDNANLFLDTIFVGSSNEGHLAAFKEIPEFMSFKGRIELVRVPYLLDYKQEEKIYAEQINPSSVGRHMAPHAMHVAALWAVLTRMRKPLAEKYTKGLGESVARLTPLEKADLYASGRVPEALSGEQSNELRAAIDKIWTETETYPNYEGRIGASPREVKTLILNAATNPKYQCLSPLAIFEEMEELVKNISVYDFLKQEPLPGGYHENKKFISVARERYLDFVESEARSSMGLVDEAEYVRLFERYVLHVSQWVKKERIRNPVTGRDEEPDEDLMGEVEKNLGVGPKKAEFRHDTISAIAAWALSHPNQKPDYGVIFARYFVQLRERYFEARKKLLRKINEDLLIYVSDGPQALDAESRARVETTLGNMKSRFGYCQDCARDAVSFLLKKRFAQ